MSASTAGSSTKNETQHAPAETPAYPQPAPLIEGLSHEARGCAEARETAEKAHLPLPPCYCGAHEQNPPCPD